MKGLHYKYNSSEKSSYSTENTMRKNRDSFKKNSGGKMSPSLLYL